MTPEPVNAVHEKLYALSSREAGQCAVTLEYDDHLRCGFALELANPGPEPHALAPVEDAMPTRPHHTPNQLCLEDPELTRSRLQCPLVHVAWVEPFEELQNWPPPRKTL